jgi:hypothetical protein
MELTVQRKELASIRLLILIIEASDSTVVLYSCTPTTTNPP